MSPRAPIDRARGYALVAAASASWGAWSLFFRPAERAQPVAPALEAAVVLAVTSLATMPGALRDRPSAPRPLRAWALLAALGVTDALNTLLFFWAMQRTSLAVAVLSHYFAPVLVAALAPIALREVARRATFGFLALAIAGLALLLEPWRASTAGALAGAGLGLASAVFYTGNILLQKRLFDAFSAREVLSWHAVLSVAILVLFVPHGGFALGAWPAALLVAGGATLGATSCLAFLRGLSAIPASHASVLTLLEPLVAVSVGAVAWHEVPGPIALAGAALILAAAYGVVRAGGGARSAADASAQA